MIAKAMTRLFLITEIIFILLFGGLAIFLSKYYGIEGFTMAFAITYSIYLVTNLIIFRNLLFTKNPTLK
jgi:PST family polysaccharide transporter